MKITAILTGIGLFLGKAWRVIKAASKLKSLKKEIIEAYTESEKAYKMALSTMEKIKGFLKEDSDGGKKLTVKEMAAVMDLLKTLSSELKKAGNEVMEAKTEIKKLIDSIKK